MLLFRQIQNAAELLKTQALMTPTLVKLSEHTQLSVPMVRWCVRSSIEPWLDMNRSPVEKFQTSESWLLILSANVFTAGIRPMCLGLLAGHRLHVRISSRDAGLTSMMINTLWQIVPRLRERLGYSESDGLHLRGPMIKHPSNATSFDVVHAFGNDETLQHLRAYYDGARFEGHGAGFGFVYLDSRTLAQSDLALWGKNVALDIAAYDQRGCLSPQIVFVQASRKSNAYAKAITALSEGLDWIEGRLPRGPLSLASHATLHQNGGVAAVTGRWIRGSAWNIFERITPPHRSLVRTFAGGRSVSVISVDAIGDVINLLAGVHTHIKSIGMNLDNGPVEEMRKVFSSARISWVGSMQCPPIDIFWDGRRFV